MGIDSTIGWFQIELLKHLTERNRKSGRGKGRRCCTVWATVQDPRPGYVNKASNTPFIFKQSW
ncbi:hypothetical protein TSUD_10790 [Trifolium subterraneum]|nr:hypothetical protein TSUD_10790 [Trifolium subterraneum]